MKMRTEKRALDKIYKRRDRYDIPEWQREKVWSKSKKQKLIDSILRGWKLPKFYFLKTSSNPDEYDVVDGQQRLTAIFEFLDNELPLSPDSKEAFGAALYSDLPDALGDAFDDFEIEFDEIQDATEKEVKEYFQRLQEGLSLTSSEKLNAVESKLRDFCKQIAKHGFLSEGVGVRDIRYAHFDIAAKAAAIEVEGFDVGLRYDDIKSVFESQAAFSSRSQVAKRLRDGLGFLEAALPNSAKTLRNRSLVQSLINLSCRLVEEGGASGHEKRFSEFVTQFLSALSKQVELGHEATDPDLVAFQRTVNANVRTGAKTRHRILLRKLLQFDPSFADLLSPASLASSGFDSEISRLAKEITKLVEKVNETYSAKHGVDLFKATNKTASALASLEKPVKTFEDYSKLISSLYFVFWEGPGSRLEKDTPQSFVDINDLRTSLQHDVDHGKAKKVRSKRKRLNSTFKRYSGVTSPSVAGPERFSIAQVKLFEAVFADLDALKTSLST